MSRIQKEQNKDNLGRNAWVEFKQIGQKTT